MEKAEITNKTKLQGGTVILKSNKPSGVLIDSPMRLIDNILPDKNLIEKTTALQNAEKICFENGLTTVSDAGLGIGTINLIDSLQQNNALKINIYAMVSVSKKNIDYYKNNGKLIVSGIMQRASTGDDENFNQNGRSYPLPILKKECEAYKNTFVKDYVFPMIRAHAVYEGNYLLGTSIARPLIAKRQIQIAKKFGAYAVSHGSTGKGNDCCVLMVRYRRPTYHNACRRPVLSFTLAVLEFRSSKAPAATKFSIAFR